MCLVLSLFNCNSKKDQTVCLFSLLTHSVSQSFPYYQVRAVLEEIMEKLPEDFNMAELLGKAEERTPYQVVALQECERMNLLTQEIRRSLRELSLGLKVRRL